MMEVPLPGATALRLPLESCPAQARNRSETETWPLCLGTWYWPSRNGGARPLPFPVVTAQRRHFRCRGPCVEVTAVPLAHQQHPTQAFHAAGKSGT